MSAPALLLAALVLTAPGEWGKPARLRDGELVRLLSTLHLVHESGNAWRLRAFLHREDGECQEGRPCAKEVLYLSAAAFDEYPERRAYRLRLPGPFRGFGVVSAPGKEDQDFVVAVRALGADGTETCATWAISLRRMERAAAPCPAAPDPAPGCDSLRALQVTSAAAAEKGRGRQRELKATIRGPFDWDGLLRAEPFWRGEPMQRLLASRRFFRVVIQPEAPPDHVVFGGDYFGFVDAGSCELITFGMDK